MAAELPLLDVHTPGSPASCLTATATAHGMLRGLVQTPRLHARAAWPSGLLLQPAVGGAATDMTTPQTALDAAAAGLLSHARAVFTGLGGARIATARRCVRPLPADGYPLIGWLRHGLYVAVTHSGITLGPYLARLITLEILNAAPVPELAPYRPDRIAPRM